MKNIFSSLFGKSKYKQVQGYLLDEHTKPDLLIVNGFTWGMGDYQAPKELYQELVDKFNIKHVIISSFNFSSHHADTSPKEVLRKLNDEFYDRMVESRVSDIHYIDDTFKRSFHAQMTSDGLLLNATNHSRKSALAFEQNRSSLDNAHCLTRDQALAGDLGHEIKFVSNTELSAMTIVDASLRSNFFKPKN